MNNEDTIRMAREAGMVFDGVNTRVPLWISKPEELERFAALVAAAEREKVAQWMIQRSYATGHGDTIEDLLAELDWQIADGWNRALMNGVQTEREACAKVCDEQADEHAQLQEFYELAAVETLAEAIRARGQS